MSRKQAGGTETVMRRWRKLASGQRSLVGVGPVGLAIGPGTDAARWAIFAGEPKPVFSGCIVGLAGGRGAVCLGFLILSDSSRQDRHLMGSIEPV